MTTPGSILAAQRRQIDHTCPVCGQVFTGIKTARFCSNRCKQRDKYLKRRAEMTYSNTLQRHIYVPVELMNRTDVAEFRAATARFYDTPAAEIRRLATMGDVDAQYIIEQAAGDGEIAVACREYL